MKKDKWARAPQNPENDVLKEFTIDWILRLPEDVRPHSIAQKYPRVANALASEWERPDQFNKLMNSYTFDDRDPPRQGFPFDVAFELASVRDHFYKINPQFNKLWDER